MPFGGETVNGSLTPAEIRALKQEIFSSLHCAMPGNVESFDPETRTAVIRPAVKQTPLLRDVPVFMPVDFEISQGDPCLVIFADFDTENWLETGEAGEPASGRTHSLSDAFAFVGFRIRSS